MRVLPILAGLGLAASLVPLAAIAAPAYDGFTYPIGASLAGQNGGAGWGGAWDNSNTVSDLTIGAGLGFGALATSPGAAFSNPVDPPAIAVAFFGRPLAASVGADDTIAYLSVLLRPDAGFGFYGGINLGGLFIGMSGITTTYGIEAPTDDVSSSTVEAEEGTTVLLVLKAEFLAGDDIFSLYVNPTPGGAEPVAPDATKTNFDLGLASSIFINNAGGWTTDEIRLGDSFAAVTPTAVPEPGALALLLLPLLGLVGRARR